VVGTAVGYVADLAPAGAVAVPPARPDALAEAVAALAGDPARRVRLADAARVWALDRDADRTTMMMEALYERCRPVEP
jgi:glycosyltransferase involved in cell wall biosynthesis